MEVDNTTTNNNMNTSYMSLRSDIFELIIVDHRKVQKLFQDYMNIKDLQHKLKIGKELMKEISLHAGKEETVLYPNMKTKMDVQAADHCIEEHLEVKKLCFEYEKLMLETHLSERHLDTVMKQIMDNVLEHIKEEEEQFLPKFMSLLSYEERNALGIQFKKMGEIVPEHAHPQATTNYPQNVDVLKEAKELDMEKGGNFELMNEDRNTMHTGRSRNV